MSKSHQFDSSQCSDSITRITERIQERADSGFEIPAGWLFKGLTFYFNHHQSTDGSGNTETTNTHHPHVVANIARFAGVGVVSTPDDAAITHVIVDPDTSSADVSALRGSLSARVGAGKKVPHIVNSKWIEESWEAQTLLDEERESSPLPLV